MTRARNITDHEEIRAWVEERGGRPAHVRGTGGNGDSGILRIDFPDFGDDQQLEHISWEEFFEKFEVQKLALLCQDETKSGEISRFNKLVSRDGKSGDAA